MEIVDPNCNIKPCHCTGIEHCRQKEARKATRERYSFHFAFLSSIIPLLSSDRLIQLQVRPLFSSSLRPSLCSLVPQHPLFSPPQ